MIGIRNGGEEGGECEDGLKKVGWPGFSKLDLFERAAQRLENFEFLHIRSRTLLVFL